MARRSDVPPTERSPKAKKEKAPKTPRASRARSEFAGFEPEPMPKLSKGVEAALYREISAKTRAAYKRKAYKPRMSPYRRKLHAASRQIIEEALAVARGNVSRASRNLGVDRDTVYEVMSR